MENRRNDPRIGRNAGKVEESGAILVGGIARRYLLLLERRLKGSGDATERRGRGESAQTAGKNGKIIARRA